MSERGVFALDRGWFNHPAFADEPFTEREAWAWLIAEAAWKPRERRIGSTEISLKRGQVAASLRYLAERWGWSKSRVDRFLERVKKRDMIETATGTGLMVVSICNYDKYQRVSLPTGTACGTQSGTAAGQQRDKYKDIEDIKEEDAPSAGSPKGKDRSKRRSNVPGTYTREFEDFWTAYPKTETANPKAEAFKVFDRLTPEDRELATASLPAFRAWVTRQFKGYSAPGMAVWLRQRRWEQHAAETPKALDPTAIRAGQGTMARLFFSGEWHPNWGAPPGEPGCTIPADIIAEAARATGKPWPAVKAVAALGKSAMVSHFGNAT